MTSSNNSKLYVYWGIVAFLCFLGITWDFLTSLWGYLNIFRITPEPSFSFVTTHIPQIFLASLLSLLVLVADSAIVNPDILDRTAGFKNLFVSLWGVFKLFDLYTTYMGTAYFYIPETIRPDSKDILSLIGYLEFDQIIALLFPAIIISGCSLAWSFVTDEFGKSFN